MSIGIACSRALKIVDDVKAIPIRYGWGSISFEEKDMIHSIVDLLADALPLWESDGLTISSVCNDVKSLVTFYEAWTIVTPFNKNDV